MSNKKFNLILLCIAIALIVVLINIVYLYYRNEKSKIYFDLNDIKNINWVDEENENRFIMKKNRITLELNDSVVIDNKEIKFNNKNGEIIFDDIHGELYLRSVTEEKMVIWYKKAEYVFYKEFIAE